MNHSRNTISSKNLTFLSEQTFQPKLAIDIIDYIQREVEIPQGRCTKQGKNLPVKHALVLEPALDRLNIVNGNPFT